MVGSAFEYGKETENPTEEFYRLFIIYSPLLFQLLRAASAPCPKIIIKRRIMKKIYPWLAVLGSIFSLVAGVLFVVNRFEKLLGDIVVLDDSDFEDIDI